MSPRGSIPPLSSIVSETLKGSRTLPLWYAASKARRLPTRLRRCPLTAGDLVLTQETAGSTPPSVSHDRFGYTARLPDFQSGDAGSNPAAVATPPAIGWQPALRTQAFEVRILSGVPTHPHCHIGDVLEG